MGLLWFQKPSDEALRRFLAKQAVLAFSYPAVGATAATPPLDYVVDRTRIELGAGEPVFTAARAALERWVHFRLGWVESWPPHAALEPGTNVAVMARLAGVWSVNACRVVYVVDESGPICKFGFAYGTLPQHAERGEERFVIEWDRSTDGVSYDILAFSRPNHVLARMGYPLVRRFQKRFGRDSATAVFRAVNAAGALPEVYQITAVPRQSRSTPTSFA
jgi:uncharacterized protein (UPF0548 family)